MEQDSLYNRIGGGTGVRQLVTRFYDHMDSLSDATEIRAMHQSDLSDSREKLYQYFTGWFGGPPLFVERYGHPRLRARHNHVQIGTADRDAWLKCLLAALDEMNLDKSLYKELLEKIVPMADHMRNVEDEQALSDC